MGNSDKDADKFIECEWDTFNESYRLTLFWWVTFSIALKPYQLKALHRVIGKALKKGIGK